MKAAINVRKRLEKISDGSFDEDDIKLLLIELRDFLKDGDILKEICDFIAHPKRNKGICHLRVDSRYAKQKFLKEGTDKLIQLGLFEINKDKPYSFFSDQILNYIEFERIPKQLFEIIIKGGIEEIDEKYFEQYYNLTKSDVKKLIEKVYKKENGFFVLNGNLTKSSKLLIDDLLKFIRGTITGKAVFTSLEMKSSLKEVFENLNLKNPVTIKSVNIGNDMIDEIIVCILCLLDGSIFLLFDKTEAYSYISIDNSPGEGLFFSLMANSNNFSFPIITTDIKASKFLDLELSEIRALNLEELRYNRIGRNENGELKLYFSK